MSGKATLWEFRITLPTAARAQLDRLSAFFEPLAATLSLFEVDRGQGWQLAALFEAPPDRRWLVEALRFAGVTGAGGRLRKLAPRNWVAESQARLPTLTAGRFFIYGAHHKKKPPATKIALKIEASVAFGTGRHESTRGCLLALSELSREGFAPRRVLDLGTGSGILALAAARLWPARILACDNDPAAVAVAKENAGINRLADRLVCLRSEGYGAAGLKRRAPFDLILANILALPLIQMAPDLARHLTPGGHAILAGILIEQEAALLAAHRRVGLRLVARRHLGDWTILRLRRPLGARK